MPAAATVSERFPRAATLRRAADFQRCYREGKRRHGALVTLHSLPNAAGMPRLGVTVSRRVGGAVVRNRLKRWTRESFRRHPRRTALPACDLVVHFKPAAGACDHAALARELGRLFAAAAREEGTA